MNENIMKALKEFYKEREWDQFHSPKNIVMDLGSEVGELLDHFRWLTEADSYHPEKIEEIKDEIGDVYLEFVKSGQSAGASTITASVIQS